MCIRDRAIYEIYSNPHELDAVYGLNGNNENQKLNHMANAIKTANRCLYNLALRYPALRGMGTTAVCCQLEGSLIHIAHVGDSRLYRFRDSALQQLTVDHSWVNEMLEDREITPEEAKNFKKKNVLTRVLGIRPAVKVDVKTEEIKAGDIYLLCSDGLTTATDDSAVGAVVASNRSDINLMSGKLLETANSNGGEDNTTVVIVKVEKAGDKLAVNGIGKTEVLPEEDERKIRLEDRIARRLLKKIDLAEFDADLFVKKLKMKKRSLFLAILLILIPVFFVMIKDYISKIRLKPFVYRAVSVLDIRNLINQPGKSPQEEKTSEIKAEGDLNAEDVKYLLPDSGRLDIKKTR